MRKLQSITALTLLLIAQPLLAINLMKYTGTLNTPADGTSRTTLSGIFDSCGDISSLDDNCVIQGLERVGTEENNEYAKAIVKDYDDALGLGNYSTPECQLESHVQANRIIGHCMLLMNFYAIKNQDNSGAIVQYETCLQGGMQGLVYQGNIVAQDILGDLFDQRGLSETAKIWKRAVKLRKDTDEYAALMKCYH